MQSVKLLKLSQIQTQGNIASVSAIVSGWQWMCDDALRMVIPAMASDSVRKRGKGTRRPRFSLGVNSARDRNLSVVMGRGHD